MLKKVIIFFVVFLIVAFCFAEAKSLYVAPNGNDSVNYEGNDINHPWATPRRVWGYYRPYDEGGNLYSSDELPQPGDTVYFRGGTYYITRLLGSKYTGSDGTEESPIIFRNYPGEEVVISGNTGKSLIELEKNYHYFIGLTFVARGFSAESAVIRIGWDSEALHTKIENCKFYIYDATSHDNVSCIGLRGTNADYAVIRNNYFRSETTCGGVQIFRTHHYIIANNEFDGDGNSEGFFGNAIFHKHSNALEESGIIIENNYVHNINIGIKGVYNYAVIQNNLLVNSEIQFGDDGGMGDGYVGADYNKILHNILYGSGFVFEYQDRDEDPYKGCLYNLVENNIFGKKSYLHAYTNLLHYTTMDYNMYPEGVVIINNRTSYTLSQWQDYYGQDEHSISADPKFANFSGTMSEIRDFMLLSSSSCKGAGSNGKDIGANVLLVGPSPIADVNGDKQINISDVQEIVNVVLGSGTNSGTDINFDGDVNISDVQLEVNCILD